MPTTINGIGTHYYGRSNVHTEEGSCDSCGYYGRLSSYDTKLWFVFFFLPVIPLGRKRILRECSNCRAHRVVPLNEWETARENDLQPLVARALEDISDEDNLQKLFGTLIGYHDRKRFSMVAEKVRQESVQEARTALLIGAGHEEFNNLEAAEPWFRKAAALETSAEFREQLGRVLMRLDRPDEARQEFEPIFTEKQEDGSRGRVESVGLLFALVEKFQEKGRHVEALEILERMKEVFTGIETSKEFQKFENISSLNKLTGKSIKPGTVLKAPKPAGQLGTLGKSILAGCLVALFVSIYILLNVYAANHTVHVLNGLDVSYQATINGKELNLPPHGRQQINLWEGDWTVSAKGPDFAIPEKTITFQTSFWLRFNNKPVLLINPDRCAVVLTDRTIYIQEGHTRNTVNFETAEKFYTGQLFQYLPEVDYLWQNFPETRENMKKVEEIRTRMIRLDQYGLEGLLTFMEQNKHEKEALALLKNRLKMKPADLVALNLLANRLSNQDMMVFLRPGLDAKPIRTDWHRTYQSQPRSAEEYARLIQEYRDRLARTPDDPETMYLLARLLPQDGESLPLLRKAAAANPPSAFALNAIGYYHLKRAQYDEALPFIEKAQTISPGDFDGNRQIAWIGLRKYDVLASYAARLSADAPTNGNLARMHLTYLYLQGKEDEARKVAAAFEKALQDEGSEYLESSKTYNVMLGHYYSGRLDDYARMAVAFSSPAIQAEGLLLQKDWDAFRKLLEEKGNEFMTLAWELTVCAAAALSEQDDLVEAGLKKVIESLGGYQTEPGRIRLALLTREEAPSLDELKEFEALPNEKRLYMAALMIRFPEKKDEYQEFAEKLNLDPEFPQPVLREFFDKREKPVAAEEAEATASKPETETPAQEPQPSAVEN